MEAPIKRYLAERISTPSALRLPQLCEHCTVAISLESGNLDQYWNQIPPTNDHAQLTIMLEIATPYESNIMCTESICCPIPVLS